MITKRSARPHWLIIPAALLAVAAVAWWWSTQLSVRQEYVLESGDDNIVRLNRFYAAQRLLDRLGIETRGVHSLRDFSVLAPGDTLLSNTPGHLFGERRSDALLAWVDNGGHLIMSVTRSYAVQDDHSIAAMLDALALDVVDTHDASGHTLGIDLNHADALRVRFYSRYHLLDRDHYAFLNIAENGRTYILRYHWGDGFITVISDLSVFDNSRIADYEHADFLWALLHADRPPGTVWLQYAPQVPSLLELLWQHAWMFLLALLLLLAAIIWAGNLRLGPQWLEPTRGQRSLAEHIHASGRFLWRHGNPETLLNAAREHTLLHLRRRHPNWQTLSETERIGQIARSTGLSETSIETALSGTGSPLSAQEFQQIIRLLKRIENQT